MDSHVSHIRAVEPPKQNHPLALMPYVHPTWVVLPNRLCFRAYSLSADPTHVTGELVFNTSFNGYCEMITDPSYAGQMILFTHPHVGSYGVDVAYFQSDGPKCAAVLVHRLEYPKNGLTLGEWLLTTKTPIVFGVPSRWLTQWIRTRGAMPCHLLIGEKYTISDAENLFIPDEPMTFAKDILATVSTPHAYSFGRPDAPHRVAVMDFGIKRQILRRLEAEGCHGICYPWNTPFEEIPKNRPDGLVLSNGPGDPSVFEEVVSEMRRAIGQLPILAICLGHQVICQALGGSVTKLRFGHRGGNHPVHDHAQNRTIIAAHNHGFAINESFLSQHLECGVWFTNLTDHTLAGIRSDALEILSVQFHPEGAPGPHDAYYVFQTFTETMARKTTATSTSRRQPNAHS